MKKNATIIIDENWDEAEKILKEMAEAERTLELITIDMNVRLEEIKKETSEQCAAIYARKAELEATLEKYANKRRQDFIKPKTRKLVHGKLGFQQTTTVVIPKDEKALIQKLEKLGQKECIIVDKKLDKSRFKKLPADILKKAGAAVSTSEKFFCRPNKEAIVDNA